VVLVNCTEALRGLALPFWDVGCSVEPRGHD
jgi:hypothetical protein